MSERVFELRETKLVSCGLEPRGFDALSRQQQFVRHLSESEARNESGHGKHCGANEDTTQRLGKFAIRDRIGRHGVYRSA